MDYLEDRYGIEIKRARAKKPIPLCVKEYGQPFISKRVSELLYRLQNKGFAFEDLPYEELMKKYKNSKSSLRWWCNLDPVIRIDKNKWLKEFLVQNPPDFKISAMCCEKTKKETAHKLEKDYDMVCMGLRKAEGGNRAVAYKSCFSKKGSIDTFRPLWWFKDEDKKYYERGF